MTLKSDIMTKFEQAIGDQLDNLVDVNEPELVALIGAAQAFTAKHSGAVVPPVSTGMRYYATHNIQAYDFGMGMLGGRLAKTTFAVGEDVWFHFWVANVGNQPEGFEILAAKAEEGPCAESYTVYTLQVGNDGVLKHEDHMHFQVPGVYHLYLGIGFGNKDNLVSGREQWVRLSDSIAITVTA